MKVFRGCFMDVRIKIEQLRVKHGFTKKELAKKIGVSYTAYKNWYNEKDCMPSVRILQDVCAVFKITEAQLFADTDLDNLSEAEIGLLELYNKAPASKKEAIINIVRTFVEQ